MATTAAATDFFRFDNSYARLPARFYARLDPTPVASPRLVKLNTALARELGLDPDLLTSPDAIAVFAGNAVAPGSEPIAQAYAGHQFGGFSPQLGDGRAILLGEVIGRDGIRRDIQLKGSGPTPFSRRGDGRAALGPVLREYIISEAFAALGIPTTRALAAVTTGEPVFRETPLPGAILTRVAQSHIRVGTFQYFAARGDFDGVKTLADHVIARHYPEARDAANPYRELFGAVMGAQANLIAQWLNVGFIHGVMNTDNMSIAGESIDFGPCAFMDSFDPAQVYSSIDEMGRYAYGNQPRIAQWNLARLAETLLSLFDDDADAAMKYAQSAIDGFSATFEAAYARGFRRKLGLLTEHDGDLALGQELLACMATAKADFTLTFRALCNAAQGPEHEAKFRQLFTDQLAVGTWLTRWRARLAGDGGDLQAQTALMRSANPMFIPRNHRVEEALAAATTGDFQPFEKLLTVLARPFDEQPDAAPYADPPRPEQVVRATFCGT